MADKKMEAVAAIDPADQGRFGAALFSSGQLFAVSARYHTPAVLTDQIARKAYRDVYGALNDARVREAKFFVQDLGADGLDSSGASVDVVYEDAVHQTIFDGHPERRRISKREYAEKFRIADERYRHLLQLLLDAAKGDR
jgi:hypothetical protein